jgi:vacuolar protein sorting-associated protein IST1
MDFFWYSFSEKKIKPSLKMAVQRIKIVINKKSAQLKHQKREIALLLSENKTEKARIKVEHIIREDFLIESYELIELLCELVHERIKYIASEKHCPDDLLPAVVSIIWSAPKVDIVELVEVRKQLVAKYGKQFAEEASQNSNNNVNERLHEKLALKPPSSFLVTRYLEEIAKEYNVDWSPPTTNNTSDHHLSLPEPSPQGFSISMAPGSDLASAYQRPVVIANMEPTYEPVSPAYYATIPTAPANEPQVAIPIPHNDVSVISEKNNNNNNNVSNVSNGNNGNNVSLNPVNDDGSNDNNPKANDDETNNTNNATNNKKTDNDDNNDTNDTNDDSNNKTKDDLDELTARFNALK